MFDDCYYSSAFQKWQGLIKKIIHSLHQAADIWEGVVVGMKP